MKRRLVVAAWAALALAIVGAAAFVLGQGSAISPTWAAPDNCRRMC